MTEFALRVVELAAVVPRKPRETSIILRSVTIVLNVIYVWVGDPPDVIATGARGVPHSLLGSPARAGGGVIPIFLGVV